MFFIKYLTEPGDTVLDIFAGSNTTGAASEALQRRWIGFEQNPSYLATSALRFIDANESVDRALTVFDKLMKMQETISITRSV